MDRPVLLIEAPKLDDDAAVGVMDFLQELTLAFESHYYEQLQRYAKSIAVDVGNIDKSLEGAKDLVVENNPPF